MVQESQQCAIIRGGTSKGIFVPKESFPEQNRDERLLSMFGSPDIRQIDGLGGATSTTSKFMMVGESDREDVDAEFTFAQVSVDTPVVDYGGTCGNLTFAIGPYAIDEGIVNVDIKEGRASLRLFNTNTESYVEQSIPIADGRTKIEGDFVVHGVPRAYPRIDSTFLDPAGLDTGSIFPLGGPTVELETTDGTYDASVLDVVNPVVFIRASDVDLRGTELPKDVDGDSALLERIERIRAAACEALGYVESAQDAAAISPGVPKIAFVSEPNSYTTSKGTRVERDSINITARIMSMQKLHPVYAVSGACCTASAALLPGTIPNQVASINGNDVSIGHPMGPMTVSADIDPDTDSVESVTVSRNQRRLMDGIGYYVM